MKLLRTALVVAGLLLTATTLVGQNEFKSWPLGQAPQELRPAISRADQVVVAMQDKFMRELKDAMAKGGPTGAIDSCHLDATAIAQRVGREQGIAAGRTSDRLRSPTNAPKPWAADLVKAHTGRPARSVDGFAVDLGDKVGVLRPIAMQTICVGCHGPNDRLAPGVKGVLKDQYPSDRATGFGVGEIRGWFWVEVPKQQR
jgi:Protein of unknown function (DUF3365)